MLSFAECIIILLEISRESNANQVNDKIDKQKSIDFLYISNNQLKTTCKLEERCNSQ